ncbi:MAG TPA: FtsX-like permease family protein [Rectinemataceae bacterium]|nr:FtsX-like permease family protein [Rectinemataceae bacterium]
MPVLLRIALRNLLEHKAKSLIIGVLLALGVVILVVGNSFMDTAAKGVKDTFIANYTGNVFVSGKAKSPISLFGIQSVGQMDSTPVLPDYDKVLAKLDAEPGVKLSTGQVTGYALFSPKDSDNQGFAMLFGIDPSSYYKTFDGFTVLQGRLLKPGEDGIVMTQTYLDRMKKDQGWAPTLGDTLLLTGMSKVGFKIRSVTLVGIVRTKNDSDATSFISWVNVDTVRILQGYTLGNDEETPVSADQKALLAATDEDALFGAPTVIETSKKSAAPVVSAAPAAPRPKAVVDQGAWNFLIARTDSEVAAAKAIADLNAYFAKEGIDAQAADWKTAAGPFAQSIDVIRIVFNVAIIIVAIVAVIIMMNTLVISVIERTGEIGTMRALGAPKGFVRKMFLTETLAIAVVFGFVGLLLSFGVIAAIQAAHIQAGNGFLEILFAGKVLNLSVNPMSVAMSLILVALVAVLAHLYPVSLALKVEPVRAMQTE